MGAIEQVIANSYVDAIRSLGVRQTWDFKKPDILILDLGFNDFSITTGHFVCVNYTTIHNSLDTIESDFYNLCFKKMCLAQILLYLSTLRSKYSQIATPFGQLDLNVQTLYEQGSRMMEECSQFLAAIPPDRLIVVGI